MSIPMIEKHTRAGKAFLQPADLDGESVRDLIFQRGRFSNVTELLRKLDRISPDDFSEVTNKYLISAEHINDAYIAVLAIYWSIVDKLDNVGGLILFDEAGALPMGGGFPAVISLSGEMGGGELLDMLSDDHNPVIHSISSAGEISRDILLTDRVEFFISTSGADKASSELKNLECCCQYVAIESDKSEDARTIITDYFLEKECDFDGVEKEINSLVRSMKTNDEYLITAAARKVFSNHLLTSPDDYELTPEDFKGVAALFSTRRKKSSVKSSRLVGLERETEKINGIIDSILIDKMRNQRKLSKEFSACSMVFAGPPGTAKTTIARMFAEQLADKGIIKNASCFKECVKSDYVGQYVGHTAAKVDALFSELSANGGGVIFFDEIYTLSEANSTCYDKEAVTSITQNMENYRENVFCIFAGYENKMNEFLASNPGLKSRMSFTVKFEGYSDKTLCGIFGSFAAADNYKLPAGCEEVLCSFFRRLRSARGEQFGNGREARNLFVNAKQKHAQRICSCRKITSRMLTVLEPVDIAAAAEEILSSELTGGARRNIIGF